MSYFYDVEKGRILIKGIDEIPENAIAIDEDLYQSIIDGKADGRKVIVENQRITLSPAPPSPYHEWRNQRWELPAEIEQEQAEQKRSRLIHKIAEQTDGFKAQILAGYPQSEIESFYRQETEAREWVADNTKPTPMLSAIAENRGVPLELLVQKVIEKADQIAVVMGHIFGSRQAFEERILGAKSLQELTAIEQDIEQWQHSI